MKYAKADCKHVVDAADFFIPLDYNINIGFALYSIGKRMLATKLNHTAVRAIQIHFPHLTDSVVTLYK